MTILYGTPADPDGFDRYYRHIHVPLAQQMTGLTGWTLTWLRPEDEAASGIHLIADLYTATADDMAAMLASPAGVAARDDLDNFVTGSVQFLEGREEVLVR